jgi:phosphoglucomutase
MIEDEIKLLNKESLIIPYYPRTEFVEKIDFQTDYLSLLQERIDFDLIRKSKIRVAADSLYGTSREYLDGILEENHIPVEEIHGYIDPYFGGIAPSSTEENLTELKDLVRKKKCHIGIATDCDGDRFGVVDERGRFVDPNLVLSLILDYLVTQKKWRGGVARSVATTHLIDQIARRFELPVYKTPVGFKFIAELFLEDKIIFGGEESACFALKDHLPEKDGIIAGLLLVEILAAMGKTISELIDDLFKKYGRKVGRQVSINLTSENERRLKNLINNPIKQLGDRKIINIETIDGIKLDFSDDDWILFRLSGTEPLIRFYVEAGNKKELDKLMKLGIERIV